jgi:drug/metabolite transporter (DMT)-like permease
MFDDLHSPDSHSHFEQEPLGLVEAISVVCTVLGICITIQLPKLLFPQWFAAPCSLFFGFHDGTTNCSINSSAANSSVGWQNATLPVFASNLTSPSSVGGAMNSTTYAWNDLDRPWTHELHLSNHAFLIGVTAALASIVFTNGIYITLRRLKSVHYSIVMFNFGWVALLESTIATMMADGFVWPTSTFSWSLLVLLGMCSFGGQTMLTLALQCDHAAPVSLARCTVDILLSFVCQYAVFGQAPNRWSIVGGLLITSCIVITSIKKIQQAK